MPVADRLLQLSNKINQAKDKKLQLEGKLQLQEEMLQTNYKCSSVTEAETLLKSLQEDLDKVSRKLDSKLVKIDEKFKEHEND